MLLAFAALSLVLSSKFLPFSCLHTQQEFGYTKPWGNLAKVPPDLSSWRTTSGHHGILGRRGEAVGACRGGRREWCPPNASWQIIQLLQLWIFLSPDKGEPAPGWQLQQNFFLKGKVLNCTNVNGSNKIKTESCVLFPSGNISEDIAQ